jgi:hypothetical protein
MTGYFLLPHHCIDLSPGLDTDKPRSGAVFRYNDIVFQLEPDDSLSG